MTSGTSEPGQDFRLTRLDEAQRKVLKKYLGGHDPESMHPRAKARLEARLGVYFAELARGGTKEVSPRLLRQLLKRPSKVFGPRDDLRAQAMRILAARVQEESLPEEPGRSSLASRRSETDAASAQNLAIDFRLESLPPRLERVVVKHLRGQHPTTLSAKERVRLETHLGAYLEDLIGKDGLEGVSPRRLRRLLRHPGKGVGGGRGASFRARLAFAERMKAVTAAEGERPPAPDQPTLAPDQDPATSFRLAQLTPQQRRAVASFLLGRGIRTPDRKVLFRLEVSLGVFLDELSHGRDISGVSPRLIRSLLERPEGVIENSLKSKVRIRRLVQHRLENDADPSLEERRVADLFALLAAPRYWQKRGASAVRRGTERILEPTLALFDRVETRRRSLAAKLRRASRAAVSRWLNGPSQELVFRAAERLSAAWSRDRRTAFQLGAALFFNSALLHFALGPRPAPHWFSRPVLALQWLQHDSPVRQIGVVLVTILLLRRMPWRRLAEAPWVGRLVKAAVLVRLVASLATPPNFVFETAYWWDRALLVFLACASFAHPAAIPGFIVESSLFDQQTGFPVGAYYPFYSAPITWVLVAFLAFAVVEAVRVGGKTLRARGKTIRYAVLPMLIVANLNASYLSSAFAKITLGPRPWTWVLHDRIGSFFVASWQYGWMPWLESSTVLRVARWLDRGSPLLLTAALLLELSTVLILLRRRVVGIAILGGLIGMHLLILAWGGALFWGWILVEGALLLLFWRPPPELRPAFGIVAVAATAVAALLGAFILEPLTVAWWNTPYTSKLEIEVLDETGHHQPAHVAWFSPYTHFYMTRDWRVLDRVPPLVESHGVTGSFDRMRDLRLAQVDTKMLKWMSPDGESEEAAASRRRNKRTFDLFVAAALSKDHPAWWTAWRRLPLRAELPLVAAPPLPTSAMSAQVRRVRSFTDWTAIRVVTDEVLHQIPLGSPAAPGTSTAQVSRIPPAAPGE